jgi:hypothetical protein
MLGQIARGLFLLTLAGVIAAYAVSAAIATPPPPPAPDAVAIQWC